MAKPKHKQKLGDINNWVNVPDRNGWNNDITQMNNIQGMMDVNRIAHTINQVQYSISQHILIVTKPSTTLYKQIENNQSYGTLNPKQIDKNIPND